MIVLPVSRQAIPGMSQVPNYSQSPAGDVLIHLAEESDRGAVNRLGEAYVSQSAAIVEALSRRGYQRIIYASSGAVYGDEHESPCAVDLPVFASDVYSKSKILNERIVLESGGAVMRLSNVIGPAMAANNVVSDIISQIPGTGPIRVRDDTPVRDFLGVSDAAAALALMVENPYRGIVNVGSGIGTSVRELAELLLAAAGKVRRDVVATEPSPRMSINVLDISATRRILGWLPEVTLQEELARCLRATSGKAGLKMDA